MQCDTRLTLGIDVGVIHLALVGGVTSDAYEDLRIVHVELINTTILEHGRVPRSTCTLHHTGMAADRVAHLVQERQILFDAAHRIIVERQPPGGLRDVEQVLACMFRDKVVLMAPQTMHAHIGSSQRPYAIRKALAVEYALVFLPDLRVRYPDKADDVADAVCLVVTHVHTKAKEALCAARKAEAAAYAARRGLDFNQFRYSGVFMPPSVPPKSR